MEDDGNGTRSDDRNAVDLMLDLFVFVPVGLLAESHALLPKLAETGRQTVNDRVQLARMIGQFAVNRGRRRVDEAVNNLRTNGASGPAPSSAEDGVGQRGAVLYLLRDSVPFEPATIDRSDAVVVVGTIDDVIIGYAVAVDEVLDDESRLALLQGLYVDPGGREVGVGEAMMDAVLTW